MLYIIYFLIVFVLFVGKVSSNVRGNNGNFVTYSQLPCWRYVRLCKCYIIFLIVRCIYRVFGINFTVSLEKTKSAW